MAEPRFAVGDRITGRCVTSHLEYTGTVAIVATPRPFDMSGGVRYKLIGTGRFYSTGGAVQPIVDEATCTPAPQDHVRYVWLERGNAWHMITARGNYLIYRCTSPADEAITTGYWWEVDLRGVDVGRPSGYGARTTHPTLDLAKAAAETWDANPDWTQVEAAW